VQGRLVHLGVVAAANGVSPNEENSSSAGPQFALDRHADDVEVHRRQLVVQ